MRRGAAVVAVFLLACGDKAKESPPSGPPPEAAPPAPEPPPAPAPPPEPEPLGPDPLSLEEATDGWELRGEGLPALSADRRHVARVQRRWKGTQVTQLALVIEEVAGRARPEQLLVWDAARDRKTQRARLDQRVADANTRLASGSWRSLVPAEGVFPDGWIRCDGEQRFELAGFTVSFRAPRLTVTDRRGRAVIDADRPAWMVSPPPAGCNGTFISGAWLDPAGLLVVEVDHCGSCGVVPLTILEAWEPT